VLLFAGCGEYYQWSIGSYYLHQAMVVVLVVLVVVMVMVIMNDDGWWQDGE